MNEKDVAACYCGTHDSDDSRTRTIATAQDAKLTRHAGPIVKSRHAWVRTSSVTGGLSRWGECT